MTAGDGSTITLGNGNHTVTAGDRCTIILGNGHNTVYVGANDRITLGNGNNNIVFNAQSDGLNDIVGFGAGDKLDFLHGSGTAFGNGLASGGSNTGTLSLSHFVSGATEGSFSGAGPGFWYDTSNHTLYYDTNGNAAGGLIAMAQMGTGVTLHNTDIHLI